ncbi:hypothetical protein [Radiobacillus sp. PE A8.2]|uniref:hypothetical protein n=1 Tax=Radiobacillus sp. PE A8.2 TaxID=3380349 RepID=UPI00388FD350
MKERKVCNLKGIFTNHAKNSWESDWIMDEEKLRDIVKNEELISKIKEEFECNLNNDSTFNAQIVKVYGINISGEPFEHYVISIGHFIYSHHYTYFPNMDSWHQTILNQKFFEDVVKSFQSKLTPSWRKANK